MNHLRRASLLCVLVSAACHAQAASYNTNLVVNGDAESGTTGWTAFADTPLFTAAPYGSNWVLPTQPGPTNRGASLFVGGSGVAYAAGFQTFSFASNFADIAAGNVAWSLSGWLGGWTNQTDNAMVYVTFLDGTGNLLGDASLGPVTPADRGNATGLLLRQGSGVIPVGTASATLALSMQRLVSGDNDGYADNIAFSISAVPEPGSLALMFAGLGVVGFVALRRRA